MHKPSIGEYTLQAVIVHLGTADSGTQRLLCFLFVCCATTLQYLTFPHVPHCCSGHYITYRMANDRWYFISDAKVREASESEVLGCQAYMLFYVSRSAK